MAYPGGDDQGLEEALRDFDVVAKAGGIHSAEALFHGGVVLARQARLGEAETTLR